MRTWRTIPFGFEACGKITFSDLKIWRAVLPNLRNTKISESPTVQASSLSPVRCATAAVVEPRVSDSPNTLATMFRSQPPGSLGRTDDRNASCRLRS